MTNPISIIVADDHNLFRQGLIEMLRTIEDLDVVGDAGSAYEAITLIKDHHPDVAILDIGMPGPGPTETMRQIRECAPTTKVVIVTMFDEPRMITDLIAAGVGAYLLKSCGRGELATAVRTAARGDDMVLVSVSRHALLGLTRTGAANPSLLSPRETDVLRMIIEAKRTREISTELHISDATVKRYLSTLYMKLGAKSRADAVRVAQQRGLP